MFLTSWLYRHLPVPGRLCDRFGENFFTRYYREWYIGNGRELAKWHRECLREVDYNFDFSEDMDALIAARETASQNGIGPADPRYPSLIDFREAKKYRASLS